MSRSPSRFWFVSLFSGLLLVSANGVVQAQHDAGSMMGGGTIGGNSGRPVNKPTTPKTIPKPKPPVRPTPKPAPRPGPTATARPPSTDILVKQGDDLYAAKRYREALQPYQKAIDINPNLPNVQYRIGWIYNDIEEYEDAIEALNATLRIRPSDAFANYELGYAYRKLTRFNEALNAYRRAVQLKPDLAKAHHDIGWIYNDQKNFDDAVQSLKLAIKNDANYADAHAELGYALRNLGRYSEAVEEYQEAIKLNPSLRVATSDSVTFSITTTNLRIVRPRFELTRRGYAFRQTTRSLYTTWAGASTTWNVTVTQQLRYNRLFASSQPTLKPTTNSVTLTTV